MQLFYDQDLDESEQVEFQLKWCLPDADLCACAYDVIRNMENQDAVQFDAYYAPRLPQIDFASEDIEQSLMAILRENIRPEILNDMSNEDIRVFFNNVDLHIDGACKETILSLLARDEHTFTLKRVRSMPRQVLFVYVVS